MYINGIVIGVFCTLFIEMAAFILGFVACKTKKSNSKTSTDTTIKRTGSASSK